MPDLSVRLIAWQKIHGRHGLPWQNTSNPYAIWVSEIMLQQTQVAAVIGYYARFMQNFPDIAHLAAADEENVLQLWSGLGYYSRARNLHKAAQHILDDFAGEFPQDFEAIMSLPGIGPSTAAAIAAFAFGQVRPILDGNVKRVFARYFLIEGWPGNALVEKQLWALAKASLPQAEMVAYTQGLMDLGATVCTRSRPKCPQCPLQESCKAYGLGRVNDLPAPRPRKPIPDRQTTMLILRHGNQVMLEKRPSSGIWGGLWSFPEISAGDDPEQSLQRRFGLKAERTPALPILTHTFTHFRLHINPQPMQVVTMQPQASGAGLVWLSLEDAIGAALPTPVRKLLLSIKLRNSE